MYYLSTKKTKVKISVTGDYVSCYSESPRGCYFKSIKKNTISSVEYKVEKEIPRKNVSVIKFFLGLFMALIATMLFLQKDNYVNDNLYYVMFYTLLLTGFYLALTNVTCFISPKAQVFFVITNASGDSIIKMPLDQYQPEIAEKVNQIQIDIFSSRKPDFNQIDLKEIFDVKNEWQ